MKFIPSTYHKWSLNEFSINPMILSLPSTFIQPSETWFVAQITQEGYFFIRFHVVAIRSWRTNWSCINAKVQHPTPTSLRYHTSHVYRTPTKVTIWCAARTLEFSFSSTLTSSLSSRQLIYPMHLWSTSNSRPNHRSSLFMYAEIESQQFKFTYLHLLHMIIILIRRTSCRWSRFCIVTMQSDVVGR